MTTESSLLSSIDSLKISTSCNQCNTFKLILRRLSNCSHLLCDDCFMICGTCTICGSKHRSKNLRSDTDINVILSNVSSICDFGDILKDDYKTNITYVFVSDSFNYKRHHNGETRLHKECRTGNLTQVEYLINSGMDVNVQDFAGWTPLHEAVLNQRINIVKLLLVNGVSVNVPGLDYLTPLHSAVQEKNEEIVKLLVRHGADCLAYNKNGKTPLDLCESDEMRNAICLTNMLPSIIRTYNIPELRLFLHKVDKNSINNISKMNNVSLMKKHNLLNFGDVKYFILGNDKPDVIYLQAAMLQGAVVTKNDFLTDLDSNDSLLNPMNYFAEISNYAVSKAGLNSLNKLPKLFDGIHFYLISISKQKVNNVEYSLEDIKTLIYLGGGKIDVRAPTGSNHDVSYPYHTNKMEDNATTSYYLIYNDTPKAFKKKSFPKEIKYQTVTWLINCINSFSLTS